MQFFISAFLVSILWPRVPFGRRGQQLVLLRQHRLPPVHRTSGQRSLRPHHDGCFGRAGTNIIKLIFVITNKPAVNNMQGQKSL